jgi:hypothetical protein
MNNPVTIAVILRFVHFQVQNLERVVKHLRTECSTTDLAAEVEDLANSDVQKIKVFLDRLVFLSTTNEGSHKTRLVTKGAFELPRLHCSVLYFTLFPFGCLFSPPCFLCFRVT